MLELEHCRTYIDHLRAEHRRLHKDVRGIENALMQGELKRGRAADLRQEIATLYEELSKHFTEEEAGGCLEEAVSRCPGVAPQADALQGEHPALLHRLEHLLGRFSPAPNGDVLDGIAEEFHMFAKDLLAHEAAENQVMQRAFGVTVNGEEE